MKRVLVFASFIALAAFAGCTEDTTAPSSKAGTFKGTATPLGNGTATPWVVLDDNGNPTSVGVTLSATALENLPATMSMLDLDLPSQASATAYNHIGVDWNPEGHAPAMVYDKPHFDVHFYNITHNERMAIMPADSNSGRTMPDTLSVPPMYFTPPPGEIVPMMGIHWVDLTSPELSQTNPQPFTKTFIYGYWSGKMIFAEPMITKAYLETKPNFTENLKLPVKYPKTGVYYGTKYSIRYLSATNEYSISLDSLVKR